MDKIEYRNIEIRATNPGAGADEELVVSGVPIVYNTETVLSDSPDVYVTEIIERGAASDALKEGGQLLVYNHDIGNVLASRQNGTMEVHEFNDGVHIVANLNSWRGARDVYDMIKAGLVNKMSFGFIVDRDGEKTTVKNDRGRRIVSRVITKIAKIIEFSPVPLPAYETTSISARGYDFSKSIIRHLNNEHKKTRDKAKKLIGLIDKTKLGKG